MARHLSSAVVKRSDMVARLKKVMLKPKYWHTLLEWDISIKVLFWWYDSCTNGLIRQVPARSVTTSDVMRMWNSERRRPPPFLESLQRRISRITRAATLPMMPAANIMALIVGVLSGSIHCFSWHVSFSGFPMAEYWLGLIQENVSGSKSVKNVSLRSCLKPSWWKSEKEKKHVRCRAETLSRFINNAFFSCPSVTKCHPLGISL